MASVKKEWQVGNDLSLENSVPYRLKFGGLDTMETEI